MGIHSTAVKETARFESKQEIKQEFEEVAAHGPPVFKTTLVSPEPVTDGKNIHLEARLEPIGDPSMKVEWFFNGRPLTIGSRFKTYNDFGFIALDILGVTTLDQGQYTCRASTSSAKLPPRQMCKFLLRAVLSLKLNMNLPCSKYLIWSQRRSNWCQKRRLSRQHQHSLSH